MGRLATTFTWGRMARDGGLLLLALWMLSVGVPALSQEAGDRSNQPAGAGETPTNLLTEEAAVVPLAEGEVPIPPPLPEDSRLLGPHSDSGVVREGGFWQLESHFGQSQPKQSIDFQGTLTVKSPGLWYWLPKTKGVYMVLLAERIFDAQGDYCYGSSGMGTTVLTPTGLPVIAGAVGNPTDAFGGSVRHPANRYMLVGPDDLERNPDQETFVARFRHTIPVGADFPDGFYRFSVQFGVQVTNREFTTLRGANPAELLLNTADDSAVHFPLTAVRTAASPRLPLALFSGLGDGHGALPLDLQAKMGLLSRIPPGTKTILAPLSPAGVQQQYDLTPSIPFMQQSAREAGTFPLDLDQLMPESHVSVSIRTPDNAVLNLGDARIAGLDDGRLRWDRANGSFAFSRFGKHEITVSGELFDAEGQRYLLGGIYEVYIAMPLDLRVAMLQGTPGRAKDTCSLATRCYPPVPAKVIYTHWLSVHGSPKVHRWMFDGWCDANGEFVPELTRRKDRWLGAGQLFFEEAGEYRILADASYTAPDGTLFMGQWESANVVLTEQKKDAAPATLQAFGGLGARQSPSLEAGLDFPFVATDLLFIAPGQRRFDPHLYGQGSSAIVTERLLPASSLIDMTNGERGFLPSSATPQGYPPASYPGLQDRSGRLYAWAVGPGVPTRTIVRDGEGDLARALLGQNLDWAASSTWTLYGGVSLYDAQLRESAQGAYSSGLVVSNKISQFSLMPAGSEASEMLPRATPFLHQYAMPPGMLIERFRAYTPQCYVFPPQVGTLDVTVRKPTGEEQYFTMAIDEHGLAADPSAFMKMENPGVYTIAPQATIDGTRQLPPSYQVYVHERKSSFTMFLDNSPGSPIEWSTPLTVTGRIEGEEFQQAELFWTLAVNGEAIEQRQQSLATQQFNVQVDLAQTMAQIRDFRADSDDVRGDLTLFAMVLNTKGELKTAQFRATIRYGRLEWVDQTGTSGKKKFWDLF